MSVEVGRRVFLGSAAAFGVGSLGTPLVVAQGPSHSTHGGDDPLLAELVKQLRQNIRALRGTRPGEAARSAASTLRLVAAHYQARDIDRAFVGFLRESIRREGRAAFLQREIDPAAFAAEMRAFGFATPPVPGPFDYAVREKVLETALAGGLTPTILATAADFDTLSARLDERPAAFIANRQGGCPDLTYQQRMLESLMIIACLFDPIMCPIISGMYVGFLIMVSVYGC